MSDDIRLKAALACAGQGWPVFPVGDDKRPRIKDWENRAATGEAQIREWAARWPGTNFGCALGRAGLLVVDLDVGRRRKDGTVVSGPESLKILENENGARLPETFTVRTPSGGEHRYYRAKGLGSRNALRDGIDVKSGGGYVVIPDSVTPRGRYEAVRGGPIAALPEWFKEVHGKPWQPRRRGSAPPPDIVPDTPAKLAAARELVGQWPPVAEGERNENLYQMARECCKEGVSEEAAWEILLEGADFVADLPEREAKATIHSAYADMGDFGAAGEERSFAAVSALANSDARAEAEGKWNPVCGSFAQFIGREPPPRPWLVQGLIPHTHQPVMIAAAPGTAKSLLGAQLCREASLGRPFLGLPTTQVKGLYITFEDSVDDLFHRASRNTSRINPEGDKEHEAEFMYLGGEDFAFCLRSRQSGRLVEGPGYRLLLERVRERGVTLVVADHASKFFPENENDRAMVNAFGSLLTRFCEEARCQWVMISHTNKAGLEYSGSSANAGIYRQVFIITRDPKTEVFTLECRKSNHTRAGEKLHFVFDDWYCAPLNADDLAAMQEEKAAAEEAEKTAAAEAREAEKTAAAEAREAEKTAAAEAREAARDDTITRVRQAMQPGEWYTAQQLIEAANLKLSPVGLGRLLNSHIKMTEEFTYRRIVANKTSIRQYSLSSQAT